jgi:hypothetical protein
MQALFFTDVLAVLVPLTIDNHGGSSLSLGVACWLRTRHAMLTRVSEYGGYNRCLGFLLRIIPRKWIEWDGGSNLHLQQLVVR